MMNGRITRIIVVASALLVSAFPNPVFAESNGPNGITRVVPKRSLIAYMAVPYSALENQEQREEAQRPVATISQVIGFLKFSGLIPDEGQVFADIATSLPLLGRYEHGLVLVDATAKQVTRPGDKPGDPERTSLRLGHLEACVILKTDGQNKDVVENLNRVVARYTNSDIAILENLKEGKFDYQRLRDKRIPEWACGEWGLLGDYFVIGFGKGSFSTIAKTYLDKSLSLEGDKWFNEARKNIAVETDLATWFIGFEPLKTRLGEISRERVDGVLKELGATNISRDLWTVGLHGRALTWSRCYQIDGEDVVRKYSDPKNYEKKHLESIPEAARHYAILTLPTRWLVDNVPKAWLASGAEKRTERWKRIWEGLESETGLDLSDLLVENLGDQMLIFDYPVHPLEVPFALTIAIEIKNARAVRSSLFAILAAWGQYLDRQAEQNDSKLLRVKLVQEDDLWYLQAGILGPAVTVTDSYAIISWSPTALRQAVKAMKQARQSADPPQNPVETGD